MKLVPISPTKEIIDKLIELRSTNIDDYEFWRELLKIFPETVPVGWCHVNYDNDGRFEYVDSMQNYSDAYCKEPLYISIPNLIEPIEEAITVGKYVNIINNSEQRASLLQRRTEELGFLLTKYAEKH